MCAGTVMMAAVEIIARKRAGEKLRRTDLQEFIQGAAGGGWPGEQLAAMLMAIALVGLDPEETSWLVAAMAGSGRRISPERFDRPAVDKHSTGGVGDKASLVIAPLAAACGVDVPMISGRGLGHTGGTLDKLESVPGFRVGLSVDELVETVRTAGCAICGASEEMAPADAVLYALRDATATVDSVPLICGSILSKKLAEGIVGLVLDVKCGAGAVFSDFDDADTLGRALVESGTSSGLPTVALVTDMDAPLGMAVGNAIEVAEAIDCLRGHGPADLRELSVQIVARMLVAGGVSDDLEKSVARAVAALDAGAGLERFEMMLIAQGGDPRVVSEPGRLGRAVRMRTVEADRSGWLNRLDALQIGRAVARLGGARCRDDGRIDLAAGIRIRVPVGAEVVAGDGVLELQAADEDLLESAAEYARAAMTITDEPGVPRRLVLGTIES
ncbi:MAG TPA: thymidine phosphorylase [Planctomycetaceae bacterium]|nr:thymidine phosphorylase [Planctomycetaceae bacterium]